MYCIEVEISSVWKPIGCWYSLSKGLEYIHEKYSLESVEIRYVFLGEDLENLYDIDQPSKWRTALALDLPSHIY